MYVSEFDYNSNGELKATPLLRKKHIEEYCKSTVVLVDTEKINSINDINKLLK